jgi:hypothetical protein
MTALSTYSARQVLEAWMHNRWPEPVVVAPVVSEVLPARWAGLPWGTRQNDPAMIEAKLGVAEDAGFLPIVKVELGGLDYLRPRQQVISESTTQTVTREWYDTPMGRLETIVTRMEHGSSAQPKMIQTIEDTLKMAWVYENLGDLEAFRRNLAAVVEQVGQRGIVAFNVGHPFGSFDDHITTIYFAHEHPDAMRESADRMCALRQRWIDAAADVGVRCFFAGGLGGNMYSPDMVERWMTPYCRTLREHAHRRGAVYYLHECGSMAPKLARGVYHAIAPDWLEGFEAPPLGDIDDLAGARRQLPESIVLKGNLNLVFLQEAPPDAVERQTLEMLESLRGFRHMVGGACSLLGGTPIANLRAMARATRRFLGHAVEQQ